MVTRKYASKEEAAKAKSDYNKQWYQDHLHDPDRKSQESERNRVKRAKFQEWMNRYKQERGCLDCGFREIAEVLDFDHMDGKRIQISGCNSIDTAFAEIQDSKCIVRCSNCHRLKSWCESLGVSYDPKNIVMTLPKHPMHRYRAEYKIKRGCVKCSYNNHHAPLDFHHIGEKGMQVSRIGTVERFILEMALFPCEILCANCHRIHHSLEISH